MTTKSLQTSRSIHALILSFGVVLLCILWTGLYYKVQAERLLEEDAAAKDAANYVRLLEENTARTIKGLDQVALFLKDRAENGGLNVDIRQLVRNKVFEGQPFVQLRVIDAAGELAASDVLPVTKSNFADREYFKVHQQADSGKLFISRPLLGSTSVNWSIHLSRRINRPDGSFGGIAVISMDPYYLTEAFHQVDLGEHSSMSVIGVDGYVLVRKVGREVQMGLDFGTRVIGTIAGRSGNIVAGGLVDHIRRFYSYRSLYEYPLIVAVGLAEQDALAPLQRRIDSYYKVCGALSVLILLFVAMLLSGTARARKAEKELAGERNLLLALINSMPDRVHIKDRNSRFVINNIAHLKALGVSSQAEALGKSDYDFRPASVSDRHYADDQSVMANDRPRYNYEEQTVTPSGEMITVLSSKVPFHNSNGEVVGVVGISRDITGQKKIEARRQRQRRMLELLAQGASLQNILQVLIDGVESEIAGSTAAVWLLDERRRRLHPATATKLPHDLLRYMEEAETDPAAGPCIRAVLSKARVIGEDLGTGPYGEGFRDLMRNAGLVSCWTEPIFSEDGDVLGALALYFTVPAAATDEQLELLVESSHWAGIAVEKLRQEEQLRKLSLAVEQSPASVLITDTEGDITYVNRRFTEVSGYEAAEVLGQKPRALVASETAPELTDDLIRTVRAGGVWQGEFINRKKSGEQYYEKVLVTPIRSEAGTITHFLAVTEDVTELKRSQQALEQAREAAESANRMKSAFVANISHEIRTPMNAIMGFTEILLRDASLTERQRQHLETIERSGGHLLELINDVLEMSRIEAGRSKISLAEFDVRTVLYDLGSMFRTKADEKALQLTVQGDPSLPASIVTDRQKFRQILINLVGNALKFTNQGRVAVHVWSEPAGGKPGFIRLLAGVEDTGPGIAPADMSKLFESFSQTAAGTAAGGAGLGLTISRNYARLLGGDITVTSEQGTGSRFLVEILAETGRPDVPESDGSGEVVGLEPGQRAWRILAVDDERINRLLLCEILDSIGFDTRAAVDGEGALAAAEEWRPDLVLMDVQMPGMGGYEATRRIKAVWDIPVIGISAGVFEQDRQQALASGMDAFLVKPFNSRDLLRNISEHLPVKLLFRNRDEKAAPTAPSPTMLQSALARVPAGLLDQIRASAGAAEFYELIGQVKTLEQYSPELAVYLREFAVRYDYENCLQILGRGRQQARTHSKAALRQPQILVVDDVPENLQLLGGVLLGKGYGVRPVTGGRMALEIARRDPPDLVLLDITMPEMSGYEVCEELKADPVLTEIPVIFISALSEMDDKVRAFGAGGVDFITKPFKAAEVQARVDIHLRLVSLQKELRQRNTHLDTLVREQVQEISESQHATIVALAKLAESRDDETGRHLERVQRYCVLLAQWLKDHSVYGEVITPEFVRDMLYACPLHDIGKVGIPDTILLKPGKLTAEEFETVKRHSAIGAETLKAVQKLYPKNSFINMGVEIARAHHEKWDGTGYPDGLSGAKISLAARIMAVADVYDALRSKRVYKPALSHRQTCGILAEGSGSHFDPVVIGAFLQLQEQFDAIQTDFAELEKGTEENDRH